ncbi:MAG: hypothetical protein AAFQ90_04535 [Pseudomonadota bacterium]
MIWAVASIIAVGVFWLGIAIARFNLRSRAARSATALISKDEREEIFRLVEKIGTATSKGSIGILSRPLRPTGSFSVILPDEVDSFPWSGMAVTASVETDRLGWSISFDLSQADRTKEKTSENYIRWLKVPAKLEANGKRSASIYSVDRYLHLSNELRIRANALHPKDPRLFVAYLLSVDGRHPLAEPFDSLRCGLPPAWIQSARFHKCVVCSQPMRLIVQVPGFLLGSRQAEGCFYLFGCPNHPDETAQDEDWG